MAKRIISVRYETHGYGIILIEGHDNKWYFQWDPDESYEYNYFDKDFVELEDFEQMLEWGDGNIKNLTVDSFADLPEDGIFASEDEVTRYIVSKFGDLI